MDARVIVAAAQECGVGFWASRREVRSEKLKNRLLQEIPQLQWVGVNTKGCVATICVRQRAQGQPRQESPCGNVVAIRDGIISSVTVSKGNALCTVGQAVKAGDVLVSGYTDCGLMVKATGVQAEIMGQTARTVEAVTLDSILQRGELCRSNTNYSLRLGKNIIYFSKDSGISPPGCVRIYEEKNVTLPGGYELPVTLIKETVYDCDLTEVSYRDDGFLESAAEAYLQSQMVAGTILSSDFQPISTITQCGVIGRFSCLEMIGKVQIEGNTNE